ncbi:MAG: TIGR03663 family protein [Candidatus Limnocylindrales bacterium]|nr:TIGR03663 family protein [Candidatus Limnocylindrales bacterium]
MKSRDRRKGRVRASARPIEARADPAADLSKESGGARLDFFDRWFLPIALGILLVAAALRLPELALNPFHHDEGVNGFFTTNLVRNGFYSYDPANYHGPSLYYFALVSEILFGLTTEAMRLVPVMLGLLLVGLVFPLRRYLGSLAALVAGGLLAISPGAVYMSRYFIHETLLVAFSLALLAAVTFYLDRRESKYLLATAVAAALLFATKETGIITVVVLLIAVVIGHFYTAWRTPAAAARRTPGRPPPPPRPKSVWIEGVEYRPARRDGAPAGPAAALSPGSIPGEHIAGAAVVFLVIYVLLYSSFFTNFPQGLIDSLATFTIWTQTGEATQVQPIYKYLQWMLPVEAPILVLGVIGGLVTAIRAPSRLWVVIGLWAAGITTVYSIIQYKTPWIILNMLLPLALLAGLAVSEMWRWRRLRLGVPVVLGAAFLVSGFYAIDLNYNHYDDETYPYVFVHSTRDMLRLVDEIEATAERAGTGHETGIVFVTPDYWPLPWYFRDYPRAGFFGSIVETQEAMIIANVNQEAELAPRIEAGYDRVGTFNLRPGVDLVLYVRSDVPRE